MDEKINILLVDDIPENLEIVSSFLFIKGYNVTFTENGQEALKVVEKKEFDLILLDIMMPEMDGYQVCKLLKSNDKTKNTPVIFLTAKSESIDIVRGFDVGAVDFITKPFNSAELLSRVETHIELKKSHDLIAKQNLQLKLEIAKRKEANDKITEQNKILEDLYHNLTSSISYASIIQKAVLPTEDYLKSFIPQNFIISLPKDVVSGDFFWMKQINDYIIVAAADCTGHGVPGAFMSMLGVAFLTEITTKANWNKNYTAAQVLNELRQRVKVALHQNRKRDAIRDGMDIALCAFNLSNKIVQFAGANNPLYITRLNKDTQTHELITIHPDKMPIATYLVEKSFKNNIVQLECNDKLYIFSDGYYDQFGGEMGQKFMKRKFQALLISIAQLDMHEQREKLLQTFWTWKGDREQIDDILVIGMKIEDDYGNVDIF